MDSDEEVGYTEIKNTEEREKTWRNPMQHKISGLIAAALCVVMLFTSCRHAEQVEPADVSGVMNNAAADVLPLQEETAAATKGPAAEPVALPESIDPLGFYRAQQEEGLTADLAAEKYNAKYERIAGLYEVKNVYLDGWDARLWLQTNEDSTRIKQVMLAYLYYSRVYDALYSEIVAVLGDADELSIYDDYYNRVPIEAYDSDEHPFAIWKLGDYTLELGVNPPGNMAQGAYLVAFQGDECDYEMTGFFYEQKGPCCPHETNFHFTEECIFMDPELFRGDAAAIFEKYRATNAYNGERSRRYPDDYSYQYNYVVDGIDYLGQSARFVFRESESGSGKLYHAGYEIDITNASADTVKGIILQIYDAFLTCSATPSDSDADPHTLGVEAFDARTWDMDHYIYYDLRLDLENFTLRCSSNIRWKNPHQSTIDLSWSY